MMKKLIFYKSEANPWIFTLCKSIFFKLILPYLAHFVSLITREMEKEDNKELF